MIRTTPWTALVALLTSLLWTCPSHADLTVDAILAALAGGEFEEEFKAGCVEACGMEVGFDEACDAISGEPYGCINWTILRGLTVPRCSGKSKQIDLGVTLPASAGWEVSGEVSVGFNYLCAVANVQKCDVTQKQGATGNGGTFVTINGNVTYYAHLHASGGFTVKGPGVEISGDASLDFTSEGFELGFRPKLANACSVGAPAEN